MNTQNFNQIGGFPMTTKVLSDMQNAYALFNALGAMAGDKAIISGCELTGTTVASGVVYVNGEVFEFRGGSLQTKVKIFETVENLTFQNGNANPVIKTRYVGFGIGAGAMDWADFVKPKNILQLTAQKAEQDVVADLLARIETLEARPSVDPQIPSDWNAQTGVSRILNKPEVASPFLLKGKFSIGDIPADDALRTVLLATEVATANYMVVGSMEGKNNSWTRDNDISFVIREKTTTSFKIAIREYAGDTQDLEFSYALIAL